MRTAGNTILITGGTSGIGRALARVFHARGNQVIIAGRRQALLDEVTAAHPGMHSVVLDIRDAAAIRAFSDKVAMDFPRLNVLINNAGIMCAEDLTASEIDLADAEAMIATNLLGPIRLTAAFLPHLTVQPHAAVMMVSSGLAFVPRADTPTYGATKAAIHSYTESLRYQLKDTPVQVLELIPPYVQTELMGPKQANDPNGLPLGDFIDETMAILTESPDIAEICVERVKPLRLAAANGGYNALFEQLNSRMASGQ